MRSIIRVENIIIGNIKNNTLFKYLNFKITFSERSKLIFLIISYPTESPIKNSLSQIAMQKRTYERFVKPNLILIIIGNI
jgi:hypothetical protein